MSAAAAAAVVTAATTSRCSAAAAIAGRFKAPASSSSTPMPPSSSSPPDADGAACRRPSMHTRPDPRAPVLPAPLPPPLPPPRPIASDDDPTPPRHMHHHHRRRHHPASHRFFLSALTRLPQPRFTTTTITSTTSITPSSCHRLLRPSFPAAPTTTPFSTATSATAAAAAVSPSTSSSPLAAYKVPAAVVRRVVSTDAEFDAAFGALWAAARADGWVAVDAEWTPGSTGAAVVQLCARDTVLVVQIVHLVCDRDIQKVGCVVSGDLGRVLKSCMRRLALLAPPLSTDADDGDEDAHHQALRRRFPAFASLPSAMLAQLADGGSSSSSSSSASLSADAVREALGAVELRLELKRLGVVDRATVSLREMVARVLGRDLAKPDMDARAAIGVAMMVQRRRRMARRVGAGLVAASAVAAAEDARHPRFGDWERKTLTVEQVEYAAADVVACRDLWVVVRAMMARRAAAAAATASDETAGVVGDGEQVEKRRRKKTTLAETAGEVAVRAVAATRRKKEDGTKAAAAASTTAKKKMATAAATVTEATKREKEKAATLTTTKPATLAKTTTALKPKAKALFPIVHDEEASVAAAVEAAEDAVAMLSFAVQDLFLESPSSPPVNCEPRGLVERAQQPEVAVNEANADVDDVDDDGEQRDWPPSPKVRYGGVGGVGDLGLLRARVVWEALREPQQQPQAVLQPGARVHVVYDEEFAAAAAAAGSGVLTTMAAPQPRIVAHGHVVETTKAPPSSSSSHGDGGYDVEDYLVSVHHVVEPHCAIFAGVRWERLGARPLLVRVCEWELRQWGWTPAAAAATTAATAAAAVARDSLLARSYSFVGRKK
ncbi:hypothetical protein DFJ73DRAFT_965928 [Zopfochytrium polystomum]|nr:hypothetical protein DFJ73DRAFT_965928 [Zopfochytrium polystomum]